MKEASVIIVSGQKPSLSVKSQQEVKTKTGYGFLLLALQTDVPPVLERGALAKEVKSPLSRDV